MPVLTMPCGGCLDDVRVVIVTDGSGRPAAESLLSATVKARMPSNGKRGAGHVPAHDVQADATLDADGALLLWECPLCGYADSTYADEDTRRALT